MNYWINKVYHECIEINQKHEDINLALYYKRISEAIKSSSDNMFSFIREMKIIYDSVIYFKDYISYYKDGCGYLIYDYFEKIFEYEEEIIQKNRDIQQVSISRNIYEKE